MHKPPSGRGPGGVGINPGSSVYSRAPKGGTPAGSRPKGQSSLAAGLPVAGRLSLPTPRKVGRWVGTGPRAGAGMTPGKAPAPKPQWCRESRD